MMTEATLFVWRSVPYRFVRGAAMGPTELADLVGMSPPGVHYHLQKLVALGLVRRIPQGRTRHKYAGITD